MKRFAVVLSGLFLVIAIPVLQAEDISPDMQAKIDAKVKELVSLGTDAKVVAAVKDYNANPSAETKDMTNDKWKELSMLDPFVKGLAKSELAEHLKGNADASISELFVSGADGGKVCFFAKTTSWTHKGKDKHEVPMTGKTWQGPAEVDESSGQLQVQVSFPVLDAEQAIGSIVVGLSVSSLKE